MATTSFISSNYWSSSVYNGNANNRCKLRFSDGNFNANNTNNNNYVRCVRDSLRIFRLTGWII
ncbi:DUF1566 domain-containing protein [Parabacteroides provencensis]|uniref:DUF1566 domain-containing protein n=1 Tax=Parabacteroides provencensis TaxID=1944636 RepID=UPI001E52FC7C|nr:DUF1566 domain-containing protein [Parabacteroides provencensis]